MQHLRGHILASGDSGLYQQFRRAYRRLYYELVDASFQNYSSGRRVPQAGSDLYEQEISNQMDFLDGDFEGPSTPEIHE